MASVYEPDLMAQWLSRMQQQQQQRQQAPADNPFRFQWNDPYGSPDAGKTVRIQSGDAINNVAFGSRNVDRENVMASQGAGAGPGGADYAQRMGNQQQMNMQGAQQQQGIGQAAAMRGMSTPGGMDQWHNNMMQALQRYGGGARPAAWGQQQGMGGGGRGGGNPWGGR